MSELDFESLLYTDCVPGQGLRGGAGFQFQAVSAGVTHEVMSLVQRTSLYEAPVSWMREQRAVEDYPPSLTHVFDGSYATARGVYLGAEANGVREGNQFTHAITTANAESYGLVRPAQLWDAPWWSEKAAVSTRCEPLPSEPEPGEWTIDRIQEWVLGWPDGEEWLLAVHSAIDRIHGPDAKRILFVADDAMKVLGWIAAGTLLLPQARALRVGFRVFAAKPRQAQQEIIAVHDDWAGSLANPDRDNGFLVFNLSSGKHSELEPTDAARYWVPRFLRADPYDAIDAIEQAQRFTGGLDRPSAVDRMAGAVAVLGEEPCGADDATALVGWLEELRTPLGEHVAQPIIAAILSFRLDIGTARRLNDAVTQLQLSGVLVEDVRKALFDAELRHAGAVHVEFTTDATLPAMAESALRTVQPERMDAVLRVAAGFRVEPRISEFVDNAGRFVQWWVDNPDQRIEPRRWPGADHLIDRLRDELAARIERPGESRVRTDISRHWWPILLSSVVDLTAPLDALITSSAVAHGDRQVRAKTVQLVFSSLRDAPPGQQGGLIWQALFHVAPPTVDELAEYLRVLPVGGLTGWWADNVVDALAGLARQKLSATLLDALAFVAQAIPIPPRSGLTGLAKQDKAVKTWLSWAAGDMNARAPSLALVGEQVVAARGAELTGALLDVTLVRAVDAVQQAGDVLPTELVGQLPDIWCGSAEPAEAASAVALAFATVHAPNCPDRVVAATEKQLRSWVRSADARDLHRVGRVLRTVDEQSEWEWDQFVGAKPSRRPATSSQRAEVNPGRAGAERKSAKDSARKGPFWPRRHSRKKDR
jgi:GTPase-associated protein 1